MQGFLSDCHQIEVLAGKTYQLFAVNRSYPREVRDVFQRLSSDEFSHAQHIDLLRQTSLSELDVLARISQEKIRLTRMHAEQFFYLADKGGIDEEKAMQMAVEMEEQFVKVHVQNSLQFSNPQLTELFAKLKSEDQDHIDALNGCLRWWRRQMR